MVDVFYYVDPLASPIGRGKHRGGIQTPEEIDALKKNILTSGESIELIGVQSVSEHNSNENGFPCQIIEYTFMVANDISLDEFLLFRIFFHNSSECQYEISE